MSTLRADPRRLSSSPHPAMTIPPHLRGVPPGSPPPRTRPAHALRALAGRLHERGITRLYGYACERIGVLSAPGVSVWSNGRVLWWRASGEEVTWPAADPEGAAARLAALARTGHGPPAGRPQRPQAP
jgi:hypothetical protein